MKTTCSVDGCEKPHNARGWCDTHYTRWRKHGDPSVVRKPTRRRKPKAKCAVEYCETPVQAKGWCNAHYQRWLRHGNPLSGTPVRIPQSATCRVARCPEPSWSRSYCRMHYGRWYRHGDPLAGRPSRKLSTEDRFWVKVNRNGPIPLHATHLGPCWVWIAGRSTAGYGTFRAGAYKDRLAHRWSWEHANGRIPAGLVLDHLCWNPSCVRPSHLEPVTPRENMLRGMSMGARNARKTHCPKGHPYDEANTYHRASGRVCRACVLDGIRESSARSAMLRATDVF